MTGEVPCTEGKATSTAPVPAAINMSAAVENTGKSLLTITEAILDKFCDDNYTFGPVTCPVSRVGSGGLTHSPVKHENGALRVPNTLILEDCNIGFAGDESALCQYCGHIREIDLSHNDLQSWNEVCKVLQLMPNLEQVNLSRNRRLERGMTGEELPYLASPTHSLQHPALRTLVLNNTGAPLETLAKLWPTMPNLGELHVSLNGYTSVPEGLVPHPGLRTLYLTDNRLAKWSDVTNINRTFPHVENLFLTSNQLPHVQVDTGGGREEEQLFQKLRSVHLAGNGLECWECLDGLVRLMPSLCALRIHNIPFFDSHNQQQRRHLAIARLPGVTSLNGSAVSEESRVSAERFFIRHHLDSHPKPTRYSELVAKWGELSRLREVDLSPRAHISLTLTCEEFDPYFTQLIDVAPSVTVQELYRLTSDILGVSQRKLTLLHVDPYIEEVRGVGQGRSKLSLMSIQLSTAGVEHEHTVLAIIK